MTIAPTLTITHLTGVDASRPLLVLGPSLGTSAAALWGDSARLLSRTHHVVAWDLPGHGRSAPAAERFSIADLARAVLDAVELVLVSRGEGGGSFLYAGDSVGGAVGLQLLLDHPARVRGATLICTGARIGTAQAWVERAKTVRDHGVAAVVGASAERWFAPGFTARQPATSQSLLQSLRETDPFSYALVCDALADFDVRGRLGAITVPVVAVAGRHDIATPVSSLREIAEGIAGAEFVVIDDVAHLAPAERPDAVAALLRRPVSDPPSETTGTVNTAVRSGDPGNHR